MIELKNDRLVFSFPEVHEAARCTVEFQRTLRIPDDGSEYPLPPGFGRFPLRHIDDFSRDVPPRWIKRGGVMFPMYQSEAMWLNFHSHGEFSYPFALKIATGKINAVTGEAWRDGLDHDPQDYVVLPSQPWLDGYCVEEGLIRQFVAMPLGAGYSAEEQLTGEAQYGGLQIIAYPMKREAYEERRLEWEKQRDRLHYDLLADAGPEMSVACSRVEDGAMGLAPGGRMRQEIHEDPYQSDEWDTRSSSRCFVHLANSLIWRSITGADPPTTPPTAQEYADTGLPWFELYAEVKAVKGSSRLRGMKSVLNMGQDEGDVPLPENESVSPTEIVPLRAGLAPDQVREGAF